MIKSVRHKGARIGLLMLDGLCVCVSYLLLLRFPLTVSSAERDAFFMLVPWTGLLTMLTFYLFNLYDYTGRQKSSHFLFNLGIAQVMIALELAVLYGMLQPAGISQAAVYAAWSLQLLLLSVTHAVLFFVRGSRLGVKKTVLLIGNRAEELQQAHKIIQGSKHWLDIVRVARVSGSKFRLTDHLLDGVEVLLVGPGVPITSKGELIRLAGNRQMEILLAPDFLELAVRGADLQQIDDQLLYSLRPPGLTRTERLLKRTADLLIASLILLVVAPLMLFLLLVIPLTSKGSALYVQERLGLKGKPFPLLKFRSMVEGAEERTGPILAGDRDQRITRLGSLMRATRLDELPQLINVLLGQMSLVGPRPERPFFVAQFNEEIPHYACRLNVKPGLTGYAQVMACYTTSPFDKLSYDLMYIKNYSFMLDLKILCQTVRVVLQREQARGVSAEMGDAVGLKDSLGSVRYPADNV